MMSQNDCANKELSWYFIHSYTTSSLYGPKFTVKSHVISINVAGTGICRHGGSKYELPPC